MMPMVKLSGARAALRGTTSTSRVLGKKTQCSSLVSSRYRPGRHADQPKGTAAIFSMARAPRESLSTTEAPYSAVSIGQTVEAGGGKKHLLGRGGWQLSQHSTRSLLAAFSVAMIKKRQPLQRMGLGVTTSLSNLCGHASFVVLAVAYLEADVLMLRGYAAGGIALSLMFQYYRPEPLWISISWNGLFMLINVAMIGLLLKERNDAGKLSDDPEQARMYREVFEPVDLSPVEFLRLVDLGERRVLAEGETLSEEGKKQEDVFIILEGTAEVYSKGAVVGELQSQQFVGSMAFQHFISKNNSGAASATSSFSSSSSPSSSLQQRRTPQQVVHSATLARTDRRRSASSSASDAHSISGGGESLTASSTTTTASELSRGLTISSDSIGKNPPASATQSSLSNEILDEAFDDAVDTDNYVPSGGGVFAEARKAGQAALGQLHHDSLVGTVAKSIVPVPVSKVSAGIGGYTELEPSSSTVTATTDVVAYAWNMHLLKAFIKRHPAAGVALQTVMSADLSRKVKASRGQEDRYRIWLQEALAAGEVTPIEKEKLERYRKTHGISLEEHRSLLKQLDWEEEDFEAGFRKGVALRDGSKNFQKYEELVRQVLAKGKVDDKTRQQLRLFRTYAGIDAREHIWALEKQGWTADDYEVGSKGKAAELVGVNVMNIEYNEQHDEEEEEHQSPRAQYVEHANATATERESLQELRQVVKKRTTRILLPRGMSNC